MTRDRHSTVPWLAHSIAAGVALMAVLILIGGRHVIGRGALPEARPTTIAQAAPAGEAALPEKPSSQARPPAAARAIAPDIVSPPVQESGYLERADPRPPLTTPLEEAPPEDSSLWTEKLLYRGVADSAGTMAAGGYRVTLAGIRGAAADMACGSEGPQSWPCGSAARAAFRAWLRGRAITCLVPAKPAAVTTRCRIGNVDAARWLVTNGWAWSESAAYTEAQKAAERDRRGIFGAAPAAPEELPAADVDFDSLPDIPQE